MVLTSPYFVFFATVITWAKEIMRDKKTSKYVDGMAFHWYFGGGERLLDGSLDWSALNM